MSASQADWVSRSLDFTFAHGLEMEKRLATLRKTATYAATQPPQQLQRQREQVAASALNPAQRPPDTVRMVPVT